MGRRDRPRVGQHRPGDPERHLLRRRPDRRRHRRPRRLCGGADDAAVVSAHRGNAGAARPDSRRRPEPGGPVIGRGRPRAGARHQPDDGRPHRHRHGAGRRGRADRPDHPDVRPRHRPGRDRDLRHVGRIPVRPARHPRDQQRPADPGRRRHRGAGTEPGRLRLLRRPGAPVVGRPGFVDGLVGELRHLGLLQRLLRRQPAPAADGLRRALRRSTSSSRSTLLPTRSPTASRPRRRGSSTPDSPEPSTRRSPTTSAT